MAQRGAPLLTIDGLVVEGYQDDAWRPILRGVTLRLDRGEVLGLIGESGAGKSTIGIAAMGYVRAGCRIVGGSIAFDGEELTKASERTLRRLRGVRIAFVAQSAAAAFNPAHRLIDQLVEIPVQHGVMRRSDAERRARELYRRLDLPDPEHIGERFPHQVSGGQLQRAMVAMAMSCQPDLIIFDEPTTALDVTTQIEVLAAIRDAIRDRDAAAIYITHDLAVVAQIADRIMVLRHGSLVEEGATRALLASPREDYTRALLAVRKTRVDKVEHEAGGPVLLEVDAVTASYAGGAPVLQEVSLKVAKGDTVAVVGESGSGKSTLARVIVGLLAPARGSVRFQGEILPPSFRRRERETLQRIQMVGQMPDVALNPRHKVRDILARPLAFYFGLDAAARRHRVVELLDLIELGEGYADRFPSEISGGEKQRICIARALAARPELIICDEVTSALDQLVAGGILKLLQKLQNELGVGYLFITHDIATVRAIADHIVVMHRGRVVEQGPKDQILAPPHAAYTELLLSSVPEMDPDWLPRLLERRRQRRAEPAR